MPRPTEWAEDEVTKLRAEVDRLKDENMHLFETNGDLANIIGRLEAERKNCPPASESEYVKRLENDLQQFEKQNFALAADQCHDGYSGEHGHHMCREVELWKSRTFQGAEIIKENVNIITELRELVKDLADDLEVEVEHHYKNTKDYPSEMRRYERDMTNVWKAREALKEE